MATYLANVTLSNGVIADLPIRSVNSISTVAEVLHNASGSAVNAIKRVDDAEYPEARDLQHAAHWLDVATATATAN